MLDGTEIALFKQTIQGDEQGWLNSDPALIAIIAKDAGYQIARYIRNSQSAVMPAINSPENSGQRDKLRALSSTFFLSDFSGAPGDGNRAILKSLKFLLNRELGTTVSNKAGAKYTISGSANISPPIKGQSKVAITWLVYSETGKELGKVTQANKVSAGSLDTHWGLTAFTIAQGALEGIRKVVSRNNNTEK